MLLAARMALGTAIGLATAVMPATPPHEVARLHATVLFVDIVDSTRRAIELGDSQWLDLREAHEGMIRRALRQFGGHCLQLLGDGVLAMFDNPAAGVCCATRVADGSRTFDLEVRAGLHSGECERRGKRFGGIVFHVAARVVGCARASEVLVTDAVKRLLTDRRFSFADRGARSLKGLPGEWPLFAVAGTPGRANAGHVAL